MVRYEVDVDPDRQTITSIVLTLRSAAGEERRLRFLHPDVPPFSPLQIPLGLFAGAVYVVDTSFRGWESRVRIEVGSLAEDKPTFFYASALRSRPDHALQRTGHDGPLFFAVESCVALACSLSLAASGHPDSTMANSIICRLAYLVVPRPELLQALGLEATSSEEVNRPVTIITAAHDYEQAFEGRKRVWRSKAKQDFVSDFVATWSADFPDFTNRLQPPDCFNQWWSVTEIDAIEVDPAWTHS